MNKNIKGLISGVSIFVITLIMASAVNAVPPTGKTVRGKIKTSTSANAVGALVTVTCNGNVLNDTTDSNGDFEVNYTDAQCANGDAVTVNASLNGESASEGTEAGTGPIVNFNVLNLLAVASVPEFGVITGAVAALGSAAAYFGLKRKMA